MSDKPKEDKMDTEDFSEFETIKKEKDYSQQTNAQIEESRKLVEAGGKQNLRQAIEGLLSLEKLTRNAGDGESTGKIVVEIVRLCAKCRAWSELNENVVLISKKRTQIKLAIAKMVQESMTYIDQTPTKEIKLELINTLRQVTEGKMYVETERARLVRMLAQIKEEEGDVREAADIMQEVQIETVGSMEPREKIDFILEQMRLTLDNKDYVRAHIISRKITAKSLADKDHQDLKIRYYKLMIRYYTQKKDYLEICKSYYAIYDTPIVQENAQAWPEALENMVIFVLLSPYDNHQSDLMQRIWRDKKLEEKQVSLHRELLKAFVSGELIHWNDFMQKFGKPLSQTKAFVDDSSRMDDLKKRAIENNLRIIAKYYSKIHMQRLAELLALDVPSTEQFISQMVTSKTISAKIDRLDGIVTFKQTQEHTEILNNWSFDIVKLLSTVENTLHLINSQYMVHASSQKLKGK